MGSDIATPWMGRPQHSKLRVRWGGVPEFREGAPNSQTPPHNPNGVTAWGLTSPQNHTGGAQNSQRESGGEPQTQGGPLKSVITPQNPRPPPKRRSPIPHTIDIYPHFTPPNPQNPVGRPQGGSPNPWEAPPKRRCPYKAPGGRGTHWGRGGLAAATGGTCCPSPGGGTGGGEAPPGCRKGGLGGVRFGGDPENPPKKAGTHCGGAPGGPWLKGPGLKGPMGPAGPGGPPGPGPGPTGHRGP